MTEHKAVYLETLRDKMAKLNGKIDRLQEKADQAGGEMKMQYQKSIEELRAMYAQAEEKIENLPNSLRTPGIVLSQLWKAPTRN